MGDRNFKPFPVLKSERLTLRQLVSSDANEIYGSGKPLLLLHGDTFGYISEFDQYIPLLAKHFKAIAMAMRGHGKSEIGTKEYSYKLFAEDALAILRQEKVDSTTVLGFSAEAITTYYLAAHYPEKNKESGCNGWGH